MNIQKIFEAKDLQLYKRLLQVLGDYSINVPCTGVDRIFDLATEHGAKIMPKDKIAICILDYVLSRESTPLIIQQLLNMRFSDLPIEPPSCRPIIKPERRHEIAFWTRGNLISDRVKDLIDWEGTGKQGLWTDISGKKHEVIDTNTLDVEGAK